MAGAEKKKLNSGRHASAIKRARQTIERRRYNKGYLKKMRQAIKAVRTAIAANNKSDAEAALKNAGPIIAKSAGRGVIPKGRASRFISRLTIAVNKLAA